MRLEKYLAKSGVASRRTAQKQIIAGRVTVNNKRVLIPGTHIELDRDFIEVDGQPVEGTPKPVYLMLNKPPGYVTTVRDERHRPTVMEFVKDIPERIYPVGRLDRDTEGLLLLTNDGEFANRLTHPRHEVKKTYIAWVRGKPSKKAIHRLRKGVKIKGGFTSQAEIAPISHRQDHTQFRISIREGKKRQIRRMFQAVKHEVTFLKRIAIGELMLGDLPVGRYRMLSPTETDNLRK
ncbi:MAG: pseudouridine synthase [Candidatus Poribacteria bacterium]|nr:pseudouridine synthase [Candidatus Poribacteria bacterium]MDE0506288.1 pseudouridine synthase [Candidatus Poribacteria bacterium]